MSDHSNYSAAGYRAVMIGDTAFFRNPNYHKATDTPDTLDYKRMGMVVTGTAAAVEELAKQKHPNSVERRGRMSHWSS